MKLLIHCFSFIIAAVVLPSCLTNSALAQSTEQTARSDSLVEGDSNNVIQILNQNNIQNNNDNEIELRAITPLVSPPNTENDFGFNLSVGVNQSETTAYVGVIFQPGRTDAHQTRMQHLQGQIELLKTQTQVAEAKLILLQRQNAQE